MYNLLIKFAADSWEDLEADLDIDRFYGGRLEPDNTYIGSSEAGSITPAALQRLIGIPTLLLYEGGSHGAHTDIVRYGRLTSLVRYGRVLGFTFEPDPEHAFLTRAEVMRFAKHLDIGTANHTHWAVKAGDIPPALLRLGRPNAPIYGPEALAEARREAEAVDDEHWARAVELIAARQTQLTPRSGGPGASPPPDPGRSGAFQRVVAVIVGIETYNKVGGSGLPKVDHAKADAEAFAACLRALYGERLEEPTLLIDSEVTRSALPDQLGYVIQGLEDDDLFVFYYAGHGYHAADGNRLTAADSNAYQLENTTLSLDAILFQPLRKRGARRALAFIDACAEKLRNGSRDVIANLDPEELRRFLSVANYSAVFLSCRPGEKSWSSPVLKAGIWTHHLIAALSGRAPEAIRDGFLTDASLRDYLATAVPRYIREHTQVKDHQTPQAAVQSTQTFAIAEFGEEAPLAVQGLADLGLRVSNPKLEGRSGNNLRRLATWKSSFRTPDAFNTRTQGFVEGLLTEDIAEELQAIYGKVKTAFGLRARDITQAADGASGSLDTDAFRYTLSGGLDPDDLSRYTVVRTLELRLTDPDTLAKADQAFGGLFNRVTADITEMSSDFGQVVETIETLADWFGGTVEDDQRAQTVTYSRADGAKVWLSAADAVMAFVHRGKVAPSVLLTWATGFSREIGQATVQTPVLAPPDRPE